MTQGLLVSRKDSPSGWQGERPDGVYLWDTPDNADLYARRQQFTADPEIWTVDATGLNLSEDPYFLPVELEESPDNETHPIRDKWRGPHGIPGAFVTYDDIPPDRLQLYWANPWFPLESKRGNIYDPVEDTLDRHVFNNGDPRQSIQKFIEGVYYRALDKQLGVTGTQWADLYLTGSLTTFQYSETSDCDVSVFPNYELIWKHLDLDPDRARQELVAMSINHLDGIYLPGTHHPLQFFVVASGILPTDTYKPGIRSAYSLNDKAWLVPPERSRSHNVQVEMPQLFQRAEDIADKMRMMLDAHNYDAARELWHQVHKKRQLDQRAGLGDYSEGNIVYKWLLHEGLFDRIRDELGEYIAKTADEQLKIPFNRPLRPEYPWDGPPYDIDDIKAPEAFQEHIEEEAAKLKCTIFYDAGKSNPWGFRNEYYLQYGDKTEIHIYPITDTFKYFGALHELGHVDFVEHYGPNNHIPSHEEELYAWHWALEHAEIPISNDVLDKAWEYFQTYKDAQKLHPNAPGVWIQGKTATLWEPLDPSRYRDGGAFGYSLTLDRLIIANTHFSVLGDMKRLYNSYAQNIINDRSEPWRITIEKLGLILGWIYIDMNSQKIWKVEFASDLYSDESVNTNEAKQRALEKIQETAPQGFTVEEADDSDYSPRLQQERYRRQSSVPRVIEVTGEPSTFLEKPWADERTPLIYDQHDNIIYQGQPTWTHTQLMSAIRSSINPQFAFGKNIYAAMIWQEYKDIAPGIYIHETYDRGDDGYIAQIFKSAYPNSNIYDFYGERKLAASVDHLWEDRVTIKVIYDFNKDRIILGTQATLPDLPNSKIVGEYKDGKVTLFEADKQWINPTYFRRLWHHSYPNRELKDVYYRRGTGDEYKLKSLPRKRKKSMAERSGDPKLDQLIDQFILENKDRMKILRTQKGADGACEDESMAFVEYLWDHGIKARTSHGLYNPPKKLLPRWDIEYWRVEDFGYSDRLLPGNPDWGDQHVTVIAETKTGIYSIDFTAAQYGYSEFPMVQKMDAQNSQWQRQWTSNDLHAQEDWDGIPKFIEGDYGRL